MPFPLALPCSLALSLQLFLKSLRSVDWLTGVMQMSVLHMYSSPKVLYSTRFCNQSGPTYIIKYILLIKTIVEAHKGKLLICVPACHFCLCE